MYWVNGQPQSTISLTDRSFQYGDGCFTTMLTRNGQIEHWPFHIERMESCLTLLEIPFPDWQVIHNWLMQAVISKGLAGLKLHISRGEGGRGYSPTQVESPNVTISHFQYPSHYEQWKRHGVELGLAGIKLGHNPMLAGHKHNNRIEQVLIKADLERAGYLDGVVLDIDENIVESSMANLFWVKSNVLYTPKLDKAGVAGVMRRVTLEYAKAAQLEYHVGHYPLSELLSADEVFVSNSLIGIVPVTAIATSNSERFEFTIGSITNKIQENLNS